MAANLQHPNKFGRHFCAIARILKLAGNLISVLAGLLFVFTLTSNKALCLFPSLIRD